MFEGAGTPAFFVSRVVVSWLLKVLNYYVTPVYLLLRVVVFWLFMVRTICLKGR